jgi:hypothetical protein
MSRASVVRGGYNHRGIRSIAALRTGWPASAARSSFSQQRCWPSWRCCNCASSASKPRPGRPQFTIAESVAQGEAIREAARAQLEPMAFAHANRAETRDGAARPDRLGEQQNEDMPESGVSSLRLPAGQGRDRRGHHIRHGIQCAGERFEDGGGMPLRVLFASASPWMTSSIGQLDPAHAARGRGRRAGASVRLAGIAAPLLGRVLKLLTGLDKYGIGSLSQGAQRGQGTPSTGDASITI